MNARPIKWRVVAISLVVTIACFCTSADAQRNRSSKYKPGDRVEVRDGFDWKPATVVSVDNFSGWVDARPDVPPGEAQFRGQASVEKFPPSHVRASRAAATETAAPDRPLRKWSDKSGKFSVEARYQETIGDKVALMKADGKRIEVPIAKLSDEDNRYLKDLGDAADSPFQEVGGGASVGAPGPSAAANAKKANWNGAKLVQPQNFKEWSFTPPAPRALASPSSSVGDANVALTDIPDSKKFFEDIEGVYASNDGNRVVVCRNKGEVSQEKEMYLEIVDVGNQKAGGLIPLPQTTLALDVNADANLVMLRPDVFGSGENGMLTVARFDGGRITPVQQWEPYSSEDFAPSRDIDKAWFLSENRVMTINGHGRALTIWDVESCKALTNIPVGVSFSLQLSLSPDRQLLAVIMSEGIALIDVTAGRHVATVPSYGRRYTKVAIRGDNTKLAGLSDEGVTVWNLSDGKIMSEFYSTSVGWHSGLQWTGDYLLADSKYLFDVERRILLWEYQDPPGTGVTAELQNGRLYAVAKPSGDNGTVTLVSAAIPNEAAIEQAKSLPPAEALLVVKPGDPVSIEVDIDPSVNAADEIQKAQEAKAKKSGAQSNGQANEEKIVYLNQGGTHNDVIRQILTSALESAGLKVVENADLKVKAVCKPQPPQTIRIRMNRRFPPGPEDIQERSITPHATYLEMSLKDEVLWKRGFVAQPHMVIWMQEGETLDQALERMTKPNVGLLTNAKFSPYVARPGKATPNGAYGVSQFTARGLVDGKSSGGRVRASFE
jgi:WD40 repeat protein